MWSRRMDNIVHWLLASLWHFYTVHAAISLIIAIFAMLSLRKRFNGQEIGVTSLFFLFNIALPIVGCFFTIWIVYYLLNVQYKHLLHNSHHINMMEFKNEFPDTKRLFGEGSVAELMTNEMTTPALKMKALDTMADHTTQKNISLIKSSLSDQNDEIRLYSFAIVEKTERALNQQIHKKLQQFNALKSSKEKFSTARELAYLYWEIIYNDLSDADLKKFLIHEVKKYIVIVLAENKTDARMHLLLGKIFLIENRVIDAATQFKLVIEMGGALNDKFAYIADVCLQSEKCQNNETYVPSWKSE